MAVVNIKSTAITNDDSVNPKTNNPSYLTTGLDYTARGIGLVGATNSAGSTYRLVTLPDNALIDSILLRNTALTIADSGATSYNIGIYNVADGAVVDADVFASAVNLATTNVVGAELRYEASDINTIEKRLWQLLGLSDPSGKLYHLVMTAVTPSIVDGYVTALVKYCV